jgi:DHA2 family methylenomycin A resistance protein-like MFS transporter
MYTLLLSVPILLDARGDISSLETGLVLTALSASLIVMAPVGGILADRFGRRAPTVAGLALAAFGTAPIALAGAEVTIPTLIAGLTVMGIGLGVGNPGLQTTAVESVSHRRAGMASGVYSTSRYLGSIVGSAVLTGLLVTQQGTVDGLDTVFVIVFVAAILATVVTLGLRARPSMALME